VGGNRIHHTAHADGPGIVVADIDSHLEARVRDEQGRSHHTLAGKSIRGAANYNWGMTRFDKILEKVLRGVSDANIEFDDLRQLLEGLGFQERIRGDHHIYTKDGIIEIINLQPKGSKAKPYQVKQVRALILKYKLAGEND